MSTGSFGLFVSILTIMFSSNDKTTGHSKLFYNGCLRQLMGQKVFM